MERKQVRKNKKKRTHFLARRKIKNCVCVVYTTHLAENRRTYKIYHSRHLQSRLSLFPLLPKKGVVKFSADCRIISGITIMAFVHIQISLKGAKIGKKKKKKRRRWGRAAAAHGTISLCICCDMAWCERHLVLIRRIILRTDDEKKKEKNSLRVKQNQSAGIWNEFETPEIAA